jgi:hypothetical protein
MNLELFVGQFNKAKRGDRDREVAAARSVARRMEVDRHDYLLFCLDAFLTGDLKDVGFLTEDLLAFEGRCLPIRARVHRENYGQTLEGR